MIEDLYGAQGREVEQKVVRARAKVAEYRTKLARHRAAIEAGADPETIATWMTETESMLAAAQAELRETEAGAHHLMDGEEIRALADSLGGLLDVLPRAEPQERQSIYQGLGLRLTYDPLKQEIRVKVNLDPDRVSRAPKDHYRGVTVGVRGATRTDSTWPARSLLVAPYRIPVGA